MQEVIEERFWWEEEGTYYVGLDGHGVPIRSVSSNPGHLLWSEAVAPERAARVARRMLKPDMWSGWGVRTLSSSHVAFNPLSYQRGSIWPHDNAILCAGLFAYGCDEAAHTVMGGMLDAAERFHQRRIPEVFAGLGRDAADFPVQYVGANVPQAWAAGAMLHLIAAALRMRPDAAAGTLRADPALPGAVGDVQVHDLRVGTGVLDLAARGRDLELIRAESVRVLRGDQALAPTLTRESARALRSSATARKIRS
jgi:glycogen debranching enzyme